ncbi:MAG: DUF1223 domain-containing protein [Arenicella sp.]
MKLLFIVIFLSLVSSFAAAKSYQAQNFKSSASQVSLIELYTSEGCSSCPPADHWLTTLLEKDNLWRDFVPVAFHVDYWDYIGWKDIYAKKKFSERQRLYSLEYRERTVYTPGVRAEGREWRHWRRANLGKLADVDRQKVGVLNVDIADDGSFKATFDHSQQGKLALENKGGSDVDSGSKTKPYFLTVALLGIGIKTDVKRGENAGKTLQHDFIVLDSIDYEMNNSAWQGKLPQSDVKAPRYAIAAWVSSNTSLNPIQALGGYLD